MRPTRLAALVVPVMLAIAACSGGSTPTPSSPASSGPPAVASAAPSTATGSSVSIANLSFQPAELTVTVGTTVTWTNNDSASHTVTADDDSFNSDTLKTGATFSQTFATAGTFAYHCAIHPSMKGTVTVN